MTKCTSPLTDELEVQLIPDRGCLAITVRDLNDGEVLVRLEIPEVELLRLLAVVHRRTHCPVPQGAPGETVKQIW